MSAPAFTRWALVAAVAAAAAAAPLALSDLNIRLANQALIHAIAVVGLVFAFGYCGLIHIGQAAFVGLGAYGSTILAVKLGVDFWLSMPVGIAFSALSALLIGVPMLRLRGHYLALATVGLNVSLEIVEKSWIKLTGGFDGISGIPGIFFFGGKLDGDRRLYWLLLAFLAAGCAIAWLIRRSHLGRAMIAIRDDEIAAATAGVDVVRIKVLSFVLAGAYGGLAGALFAHYSAFISPSDFALVHSIMYLSMIIIGGEASIVGAVLGTFVLRFLEEWMRELPTALGLGEDMRSSYLAFFGLLMLGVLVFMPQGIVGTLAKWRR
jgi:branched-chain amino acid transport system permease protein